METQHGGLTLTAYGQTDIGLVREGNEDAFVLANLTTSEQVRAPATASWSLGEQGILLAVSDGMGGARAGEVASAITLDALLRALREGQGDEQGEEEREGDADGTDRKEEEQARRLRRAVEEASHEVREAARSPERHGMGATLTAALICGGAAYIAEVGDSRGYLIRGGVLYQVTRDQSYVQMLVDSGVITPEEAEKSPKKNIILQVMGQKDVVAVDIRRLDLRRGDRLLLCSDGLSGAVPGEEILRLSAPPAGADAVCAALIEAAKRAGGDDNITVVLADVSGSRLAVPGEADADSVPAESVHELKS